MYIYIGGDGGGGEDEYRRMVNDTYIETDTHIYVYMCVNTWAEEEEEQTSIVGWYIIYKYIYTHTFMYICVYI